MTVVAVADFMWSPLASRVSAARSPLDRRVRKPWGLLLHTTGGGVTAKAKKLGRKPIDVAIEIYVAYQNGAAGYTWGGPGYVMDHDGALYQLAPDDARTEHAGGPNRSKYMDGSWIAKFPQATAQWRAKWPGRSHPYALFPATTPNQDYLGVEMIPCGDGFGTAMRPGLRFSQAQHDAAIRLAHDAGKRHGWPAGWMQSGRLLGHEDVDPLERADTGGCWDPGWLRASPWFDFGYVRAAVELP